VEDRLRVTQLRASESQEPHAARLEAVRSRVAQSRRKATSLTAFFALYRED